MPVIVPAVDHHFDLVMVWDNLGGAVRVRRNGTAQVVDASSGLPVPVVQDGQTVTTVRSDENGRVSFVAPQGIVRLVSGGFTTTEISAEQASAGASSAADAAASADAAQTASATATAAAATVTGKADKVKLALNVKDYGAVGNGTTDDASALNSALSAALAAGAELYWPPGAYLIGANLPSLHSVRHRGPGRITASGVPFYLQPQSGQANTLYVSTSGSNSNDGVAARPFLTLQKAFDVLTNYGPALGGVWTIVLAAGTYAGATLSSELSSVQPVTVKGPAKGHPLVPTATVTSGYNVSGYGIRAIETGVELTVQDIAFVGYNGSTAAAGIVVSETPHTLSTINVHFTDCYWGISTTSAPYDVKGGIFTRCGFLGDTPNTDDITTRNGFGGGTRSLMITRHSIGLQNAGDQSNGPYFFSCQNAVFAQERSTGHVDWVRIEDCISGLYVGSSSRVNADGTSFKRNIRAIRVMLNSDVYVTSNVIFGTGADENGAQVVATSGGQVVDDFRMFTDKYPVYGATLRSLDTQFPGTTVTATTATTVWSTSLAGGMWRDDAGAALTPRKRVRFSICGELFGTLNNKRLIVRLGSASTLLLFSATETGVFTAECDVYFSGLTEQQMILRGYRHLGASTRISRTVGSNALTADTPLTVEAQVDQSGDSVAIYSVDVSWA